MPPLGIEPTLSGYEPPVLTIELQGLKYKKLTKVEGGMGIEPMLVQHLWNTDYKSVGASSYTNLPFQIWYRRRDSNPHARYRQRILSPLCLPFHHSDIYAEVVGLEPTTDRLTADSSTIELHFKIGSG